MSKRTKWLNLIGTILLIVLSLIVIGSGVLAVTNIFGFDLFNFSWGGSNSGGVVDGGDGSGDDGSGSGSSGFDLSDLIDSTLNGGSLSLGSGDFSYTASEDGSYTFTADDGSLTITDGDGNSWTIENGESLDLDLSAGDSLSITSNGNSVLSVDSVSGSGTGDYDLDLGELYDNFSDGGGLSLDLDAGGYSFTAGEDGTYTFTAGDGGSITITDSDGNIWTIDDGESASIELVAGAVLDIVANSDSGLTIDSDTGSGSGGSGSGSGDGGSGSETSGNLDTSGTIAGPTTGSGSGSSSKTFSIYSGTSGTLYLKLISYGDYSGSMWEQAEAYTELIDGEYSMSYLFSLALENAGYSSSYVVVNNYTDDYLLPYQLCLSGGDYDIQTSDVYYTGSSSIYTMNVYYYNYLTEGTNGLLLPSEYSDAEFAYRQYVYDNYTSVNDSTLAYLNTIINGQNFDTSDVYTLILQIVSYVQGAATYNLEYDTALNNEDDIVVAFLSQYQEGVCQHFASAATLLLRACGIPARYTGGYVASTTAGSLTEVTSSSAHAWVEVYINGLGWVVVDPTPSSSGAMIGGEITDVGTYDLTEGGEYTFTAEEDGTYTFTAEDGSVTITDSNGNTWTLESGESADIDLSAGETVDITANTDGGISISDDMGGLGAITDGDIPDVGTYDLTEGGEYTFTAEEDGTYTFAAEEGSITITDSNGNTWTLGSGESADIDLSAGNTVDITSNSDSGLTISGGSGGSGGTNKELNVNIDDGDKLIEEGEYTFTAKADGTYTFTSGANSEFTITDAYGNEVSLSNGESRSFDLSAGDTLDVIALVDGKLEISTEINYTDISNIADKGSQSLTADYYVFRAPKDGIYRFSLKSDGYLIIKDAADKDYTLVNGASLLFELASDDLLYIVVTTESLLDIVIYTDVSSYLDAGFVPLAAGNYIFIAAADSIYTLTAGATSSFVVENSYGVKYTIENDGAQRFNLAVGDVLYITSEAEGSLEIITGVRYIDISDILNKGSKTLAVNYYSFTADDDGTYRFISGTDGYFVITDATGKEDIIAYGTNQLLVLTAGDTLYIQSYTSGSIEIIRYTDISSNLGAGSQPLEAGYYMFTANGDGTYKFIADTGSSFTLTSARDVDYNLESQSLRFKMSEGVTLYIETATGGGLEIVKYTDISANLGEGTQTLDKGYYMFTVTEDGTYKFISGEYSAFTIINETGATGTLENGDSLRLTLTKGTILYFETTTDGELEIVKYISKDFSEGTQTLDKGYYMFTVTEDGTYKFIASTGSFTIIDGFGREYNLASGESRRLILSKGEILYVETTTDCELEIAKYQDISSNLDKGSQLLSAGYYMFTASVGGTYKFIVGENSSFSISTYSGTANTLSNGDSVRYALYAGDTLYIENTEDGYLEIAKYKDISDNLDKGSQYLSAGYYMFTASSAGTYKFIAGASGSFEIINTSGKLIGTLSNGGSQRITLSAGEILYIETTTGGYLEIAKYTDIGVGTHTLLAGYYMFTASEAGIYKFTADAITSFAIYSEADSEYVWGSSASQYINLSKGETLYIETTDGGSLTIIRYQDISGNLDNGSQPLSAGYYSFTAKANGKYTFIAGENCSFVITDDLGTVIGTLSNGDSQRISLSSGGTLYIETTGGYLEIKDTTSDTDVGKDNTLPTEGSYDLKKGTYTFTADEEGTYTFTAEEGRVTITNNGESTTLEKGASQYINLSKGETLQIEATEDSTLEITIKLIIWSWDGTLTYDGTAQKVNVVSYTCVGNSETLLDGHRLYVDFASYTDVGIYSNTFTVTICDEASGEDVTYKYNIEYSGYGTIEIESLKITIETASAEKQYDGTALTAESLTEPPKLAEGHTISIVYSGSQTLRGKSDNGIQSITIYDEDGNDVTKNYVIIIKYGTLTVT